jgi:transposase InsO family protein
MVVEELGVPERRACRVLDQDRSTQRYSMKTTSFDRAVRQRVIDLATQYGRYGYRRITELLKREGWPVNHKRVERIWREEGLKVPRSQPKRRRLWLNDGSCVRLRPTHPNHVWSYDFVEERTHDGKRLRLLTMVDEYTRECLIIDVERRLRSDDVLYRLEQLFVTRGLPDHIRSDNGPEFTAIAVREWLKALGVRTLFIEPGSPWENGYIESFNGKLRDELLNGEIFDTLVEAKVLIERWRQKYNRFRPHSSLGYKPPAPVAKSDLAPEAWRSTIYTIEPLPKLS